MFGDLTSLNPRLIIIGILLYYLVTGPQQASVPALTVSTVAPASITLTTPAMAGPGKPVSIKEKVESYFSDVPVLVSVARCESRFRHFDGNGEVIRGSINRYDVGVMQVNELYHADKAKELNMNLYTLEGNLAYARYLYEHQGVAPWSSSAKCWGEDAQKIALAEKA